MKIVLVGTYRAGQLERWPGLYNYPLSVDDAVDAEAAKRVNEIWLFNGAKDGRYFAAEFVGTCTRDALVRDFGYPAKGAAHGERYLLYRIQPAYAPANTSNVLAAEVARVIVRAEDFAKRSPKIAREIKTYLESSDRNDPGLANRLPPILLQLPRETLCVCEPGVQMEFMAMKYNPPFPPPRNPKFTFIDLFAGVGGFRLAMQSIGGKCVFTSEWDKNAQATYQANYGEQPFGDIRPQTTKDKIPKGFDVLCAGFPCQPFSLAGVSARNSMHRAHGFDDETQGTLFFDVLQIIRQRRPRVVFLENVRNLVNHDGGRTFDVIRRAIENEGYSFSYKLIDSSPLVPQRRVRCYMVCLRNGVKFEFPEIKGAPLPLRGALDKDVSDDYTISDNLWAGHQRRTRTNLARGAGFTAYTANLDEPSHTLVARYYKDGKECLIPQEGKNPRMLTPRECARLQGFPENFILPRSRSAAYKQMGNSVAVPVLERIAECIDKQALKEV